MEHWRAASTIAEAKAAAEAARRLFGDDVGSHIPAAFLTESDAADATHAEAVIGRLRRRVVEKKRSGGAGGDLYGVFRAFDEPRGGTLRLVPEFAEALRSLGVRSASTRVEADAAHRVRSRSAISAITATSVAQSGPHGVRLSVCAPAST